MWPMMESVSPAGFKTGDSRLGCADALCDFSLRDACCGTSLEKFVKKLELLASRIVFSFHVCALKGASFKFFVSEHF